MRLTKWRTIGNLHRYTATDECFKLTRLVIARYKMESIYIQNMMKGEGSLELAMEILKIERKIDN